MYDDNISSMTIRRQKKMINQILNMRVFYAIINDHMHRISFHSIQPYTNADIVRLWVLKTKHNFKIKKEEIQKKNSQTHSHAYTDTNPTYKWKTYAVRLLVMSSGCLKFHLSLHFCFVLCHSKFWSIFVNISVV